MSGSRQSINIVYMECEEDPQIAGKYWLWLKIRSAARRSLAIRIESDNKLDSLLANPWGKMIKTMPLGYHSVRNGLNELPPLPFWLKPDYESAITVSVAIRSIKEPALLHRSYKEIILPPSPPLDIKSLYFVEFP